MRFVRDKEAGAPSRASRNTWRGLLAISVACTSICVAEPCLAADGDWVSFNQLPADTSNLNSVFLFGGRMSTTKFGTTFLFNALSQDAPPLYDNYIFGAAYQRDVYRYGGGVISGEIGIADRFGNYAECCSPVVTSSSVLNSGELWFGPNIRYDAFVLFNQLRVTPGMTAGFSLTTNSIGMEREREITEGGNARFLVYLGPEIAFSLLSAPEWELVLRVHHRSGAWRTFGHLEEGYNANVAGLRYRF